VSDDATSQRLDELEKKFAAIAAERDSYRKLYFELMERCRKLEMGLLGSKSERVPHESQLSLQVLSAMLDERARANLADALAHANAEQPVRPHTRAKSTGRKPIPEHLPRVEIQVLPPEAGTANLEGTLFAERIRTTGRFGRSPS
jgi:transposase